MTKALIILGATAVGKSEVAFLLARELSSPIISADSVQVYKHLNIGSAKPDEKTLAEIPHYLIDMVEPDQHFDAGCYLSSCLELMPKLIVNKKQIIICGGTGLYLRALTDGLTDMPGRDDEFRAECYQQIEAGQAANLFKRLKNVDPKYAALIHQNDHQRLIRALEVYEITGKAFSEWHLDTTPPFKMLEFVQFGLCRERAELYRRIDERVEAMFDAGLVDEVRNLIEVRGYAHDLASLQSLGYHSVIRHLIENISLDETIHQVKKQTRHFAKRQLTWFRKDKRIQWLNLSEISPPNAVAMIKEGPS